MLDALMVLQERIGLLRMLQQISQIIFSRGLMSQTRILRRIGKDRRLLDLSELLHTPTTYGHQPSLVFGILIGVEMPPNPGVEVPVTLRVGVIMTPELEGVYTTDGE